MTAAVVQVELPFPGEEQYKDGLQIDRLSEPPRITADRYRYTVPSSPWAWADFDSDPNNVHYPVPCGGLCQDSEWSGYPQILLENWTQDRVESSRMLGSSDLGTCSVYMVNIFKDGSFDRSEEDDRTVKVENQRMYWDHLKVPHHSDLGVRALFVENMTLPVLQMLGTRYNVEPFFFESLVNCIPSRYQDGLKHDEDHITIIIPFIRMVQMRNRSPTTPVEPINMDAGIQTQLPLSDNKVLSQDVLAIHMYRTSTISTVISCHPDSRAELRRTSAKRLQSLVQRIGDNPYWSQIFKRSKDPTILFLVILWYALYAWDEVFEELHRYINVIESGILDTSEVKLTSQLRKLQAHLLYYQQLLRDFQASVEFVRDTPNPAMNVLVSSGKERRDSATLLRTEANNMIGEICRLMEQRRIVSERVQNTIHLVVANLRIINGRSRQTLLARAIDNVAMKQTTNFVIISMLSAYFLAIIFRTKVYESSLATMETLSHFIEAVVGLTLSTWWVSIAVQHQSAFHPPGGGVFRRALWPLFYVYDLTSTTTRRWYRSFDHRSALDENSIQ